MRKKIKKKTGKTGKSQRKYLPNFRRRDKKVRTHYKPNKDKIYGNERKKRKKKEILKSNQKRTDKT